MEPVPLMPLIKDAKQTVRIIIVQPLRFTLILLITAGMLFLPVLSSASRAGDEVVAEIKTVRVGVLAKRGISRAIEQWQPTTQYLSKALPTYHFQLVPLDFNAIHKAAQMESVDFILSNPAYFVDLEKNYGVRAIATLINQKANQSTSAFGGVIFCRNDRLDIQGLVDIKQKRFMAVDPRSFGGWHVGWYQLLKMGISPKQDLAKLEFGGTHDEVVYAVRDGKVDVGTVRTDTLERMAKEGKIHLKDFRVLDPQAPNGSFPFQRSTKLYPEWPFASLPHVNRELIKQVTVALLQMPANSPAAKAANAEGWTAALNYQPVHECLRVLQQPPYTNFGKITWQQALQKQWQLLTGLAVILLLTMVFSARMKGLNKRLSTALQHLDGELQQRREAEASLSNFKQTLDQVHDCVFIFDAKTLHFLYANQGAIQQVGYSAEELADMTPLDVKPKFTNDSFRELITPLLKRKKDAITFITDYRRKNGTLMPVEVMLQYVLPGQSGRFVAVVRDINERIKTQKEKEKLQAQLLQAQKLESVGRLAAGIAHEINTPVQFISSNIDFFAASYQDISPVMNRLTEGFCSGETLDTSQCQELRTALKETDWGYLAEEIPKAIEQTKSGLQRVSAIVLAMKEFSHPGQKDKVAANLNAIIETTLIVTRNEWKYVADVTTDLDPDLPLVPCLTDEMGQVILNMLVNAAHAISAKLGANSEGNKGSIKISTHRAPNGVEMRLQDDGSGMSAEVRDHIFEPFFTTKEVGKGTGQGLAISHDVVVDKHSGTLEVETEEGVGTTFIMTLPSEQNADGKTSSKVSSR